MCSKRALLGVAVAGSVEDILRLPHFAQPAEIGVGFGLLPPRRLILFVVEKVAKFLRGVDKAVLVTQVDDLGWNDAHWTNIVPFGRFDSESKKGCGKMPGAKACCRFAAAIYVVDWPIPFPCVPPLGRFKEEGQVSERVSLMDFSLEKCEAFRQAKSAPLWLAP